MNAVREMSTWVAALTMLIVQLQIPGREALSTVYHHSPSGRKLFGGYRIVPKVCTGTTTTTARSTQKTGICMFNYECSQRGGEMIGSCIDGFLFGACCSLPETPGYHQSDVDYLSQLEVEGLQVTKAPVTVNKHTTQRQPPSFSSSVHGDFLNNVFTASEDPDELFGSLFSAENGQQQHVKKPVEQKKPILEQYLNNENQGGFIDNQGFLPVHKYSVAETVLLNPDGSFVVDEADPELLFTRPDNHKITFSVQGHKPTTNSYGTPSMKPAIFGYLTGSYGAGTVSSGEKIHVPSSGTSEGSNGYFTESPPKNPSTSEMRKTTKIGAFPTENYSPVTSGYPSSDGNLILVHTTSQSNKTVRPTPSASKATTNLSYVTGKIPRPTAATVEMDDRYPSYHYESYNGISKPPVIITSPIGFDGSGQAISHILGILNGTHGKPSQPVTSSGESDAGLSTWVSITGGNNKITSIKTGSTKLPSTTTNYVHGPAFTVEETGSKPVPTVIVISPPSTDASPVSHQQKPITSSTSYVTKTPVRVTQRPTSITTASASKYPETVHVMPAGGEESLISFPPVRNPDLNVSGLNQVEKPTIVHSGGYPLPNGIINAIEILPDDVDLNTIDPDEDYSDFTTPAMEDETVNVKIHGFVEKIVNSLAGNFQDLESVLFRNENKTKLPNQNGIELNNVHVGLAEAQTPTKKPAKPIRRPTPVTPTEENLLTADSSSKRPKPSISSVTTPATIITSKKPLVQIGSTKLTTTVNPVKRPTTSGLTTKRPTQISITASTFTTRRPTTKRPRPSSTTKRTRPATTTTTTAEIPTEEQTEFPTAETLGSTVEHSTVDFRKECGVRPMVKKGGRIVGGKGSQFGHYPWQVLVRESTWLGLFTKNKCGGVLITHRYVVTAAHCQPGFLASLVAVFGEYDISGELESRRSVTKNVRRVIVHRQYDPATFENDLALLELDSPISYEEHIVPICMPREGEDYTGRMATVTGWGRLKYGGGVPSVLQEVRVPIIDNGVCQEMFQTAGHQKRIISSFLCAGYANGQKDSCEGDSGGPLMAQREDGHWILLGTVSHGIKCAAPYLPGVYMRTTYYKPWLKSITGVAT